MTRTLNNREALDPMKLSTKETYDKRALGVDNLALDKDDNGDKHV